MNQSDISDKSVLNVKEIQNILRIGRSQAYDLIRSGKFHTVKVGRSIKVDKSIFFKWLQHPD